MTSYVTGLLLSSTCWRANAFMVYLAGYQQDPFLLWRLGDSTNSITLLLLRREEEIVLCVLKLFQSNT